MLIFVIISFYNNAQSPELDIEDPSTLIWKGTYSTLRIGENWFYEAQHHYRRTSYEGVPFVGRMAQIYNRHAVTYKFSDKFLATAGPVLRLNFSPEPDNEEFKNITLEPRFWHQYAFVDKDYFSGGRQYVIQHRLRFEHRWSRNNRIDSEYIFRNRYRYRITFKIPLSKKTFQPQTWYATPINIESILQSGKSVVNAPLEDLRIYPSVGYIFNTKIAYSVGMMYTLGQRLGGAGETYRTRWILRANLWWTPDFRKWEKTVPLPNLND